MVEGGFDLVGRVVFGEIRESVGQQFGLVVAEVVAHFLVVVTVDGFE